MKQPSPLRTERTPDGREISRAPLADDMQIQFAAGVPLWKRLLLRAYAALRRPPDFVIGEPAYLRRWWLIRNRWCNIYLHHIVASDPGRDLHDHPWHFASIILRGGYYEILEGGVLKRRRAGQVIPRRASMLHRLVALSGESAWTVIVTGPKVRDWGFKTRAGWRPWQECVEPGRPGVMRREVAE